MIKISYGKTTLPTYRQYHLFLWSILVYQGIGGFIFWTVHGGLRKHISELFGKDATSDDMKDRVGHMGDLFYYYAVVATFLFVLVTTLKAL